MNSASMESDAADDDLADDFVFEDVKVPVANRLGAEGQGFKIALNVLDHSRPGIGAQALGIAEVEGFATAQPVA